MDDERCDHRCIETIRASHLYELAIWSRWQQYALEVWSTHDFRSLTCGSHDPVLESAIEAETVPGLGLSIVQGRKFSILRSLDMPKSPSKEGHPFGHIWDRPLDKSPLYCAIAVDPS